MKMLRLLLVFLSLTSFASIEENRRVLSPKKNGIAYPDIPSVYALHLPDEPPQAGLVSAGPLSPGLVDPDIEEARARKLFPDFKIISDAIPKNPQPRTIVGRSLKERIERRYTFKDELIPMPGFVKPEWKVKTGDGPLDAAFRYTETTLPNLVRRTPLHSDGSLLVSPYPVLIAAPGRFHESYYWDTYFGLKGVLLTKRLALAQGVVENFLHAEQQYGLVPNGMRDYYLSRSQPPFLSSMVREVYEAAPNPRWLKERAFPLVKRDYENHWMKKRFDEASGLNVWGDDLTSERPERHSLDDETKLAKTFRDVRAAAESGEDFTVAQEGESSHVAGVLLNSLLFKVERDLSWMAKEIGDSAEAAKFDAAAARRRARIDELLWNPVKGRYENYNLARKGRVDILIADTFAPLFVGAASQEQAAHVEKTLAGLERAGGIMASESTTSTYQWDGTNGWAPHQVMAMQGLLDYGFADDAKRLAKKWTAMIAGVHRQSGLMFERMDVVTLKQPGADTHKYPNQTGFLWTNASYVWALVHVLGHKLVSTH